MQIRENDEPAVGFEKRETSTTNAIPRIDCPQPDREGEKSRNAAPVHKSDRLGVIGQIDRHSDKGEDRSSDP